MANITLRQNTAQPLSIAQVDNNFSAINAELQTATANILTLSNIIGGISSAVPIFESSKIFVSDHTIAENSNALSIGSVTIATGVIITVPDTSSWAIVSFV